MGKAHSGRGFEIFILGGFVSLMNFIAYIFLLFIFFVHFTKERGVVFMNKIDWVVLLASPAVLVYAFNRLILS